MRISSLGSYSADSHHANSVTCGFHYADSIEGLRCGEGRGADFHCEDFARRISLISLQ